MARYRGPRIKRCRSVEMVLPGLVSVAELRRNTRPGQHGLRRAGKPSDFKIRHMEKQKLRWHYGVLEKQFRRYIKEASRRRGPTGQNLVTLLESRLDNVIWRMGLARSIPAARQMVVHGHILVDGKRVDRPSYSLKTGQTITIREKSKGKAFIQDALALSATRKSPDYLDFDPAKMTGNVLSEPGVEHLPLSINLQAVIEYYSQMI